jgi:hypothetical protein
MSASCTVAAEGGGTWGAGARRGLHDILDLYYLVAELLVMPALGEAYARVEPVYNIRSSFDVFMLWPAVQCLHEPHHPSPGVAVSSISSSP